MSSEHLASAQNELKGNLGGAWNILDGAQGQYQDLGIARRFGGSAAAYSLRDIGAMNGRVVKVRRDLDGEEADPEEDFSANQVQSGALEDWVNGKLESTLPADVDTAAATYSLRKAKADYSGDAVRIRRSSDDVEVNVALDSDDKVSTSSSISVVSGSTTATDLNGFLNESTENFSAIAYTDINSDFKQFTSTPTISDTAISGATGSVDALSARLGFKLPSQLTISDYSGLKIKVTGIVNSFTSDESLVISPSKVANGGTTFTPPEGGKVITSGTTGNFEFIFTGDTTNTFQSVVFKFGDNSSFDISNLKFEIIEHGATVHTWYDQVGSNNAVQETSAKQPLFAESGALTLNSVGTPTIKFVGGTLSGNSYTSGKSLRADGLASAFTGMNEPIFVSAVSESVAENKNGVIYGFGNTATDSARLFFLYQAGGVYGTQYQGTGGSDFEYVGATKANTSQLFTNDQVSTSANIYNNSVPISTNYAINVGTITLNTFAIGAVQRTSESVYLDGNVSELILYSSDQSDNRFKIESNINNYYGLYNDANEFNTSTWQNGGTGSLASWDSLTNSSTDGFVASTDNGSGSTENAVCSLNFTNVVPDNGRVFVSFNCEFGGTAVTAAGKTLRVQLRDSSGNIANDIVPTVDGGDGATQFRICNQGFNRVAYTVNSSTASNIEFLLEVANGRTGSATVTDLKVSRIARNGFVETWYDQSGNGKDMIQTTAGNQPSIVSNGGYMGGVYSAPASNSTTSSNKQYMRITGTNSFACNDFTTTKVGMVAIVNSLESGTASGVSIYTVLGNIRGVQSFPTGAIGLQISGTNNSAFTNYTATNAENKDESLSIRTVGENTLIGGTMDNRNIKTFTFTEQGSDTDTTTASTDIVLTSQKDFGIFYSTFANDSGGEDLNVTRTAGGYMKEAYILDGDIIDDIDAINLELRQHYNLA